MSYYDFDYFWTHQEIGGRKLKKLEKERQSFTIENILKLLFVKNNSNNLDQANTSEEADDFVEDSTKQSGI